MKNVSFLALTCIIVCFSISALFPTGYAQQTVGVKEGDWMEYGITVTGTGSLPPNHDIRWMRMDVLTVDGTAFSVNITVKYANGTMGSSIWKFDFTEGHTGGWLIIPANLGLGDTFFDYSPPDNVPIQHEEQKTVLGATRTVTRGNDAIRQSKEWDKTTGISIGSVEMAQNFTNRDGWYIENLTMTIQATATNMWGRQILGLEQSVFALFISGLTFMVTTAFSALIIWQKKNLTNLSLRYPLLSKKAIPAIIIVGIIVFAYIVIPFVWMNKGLSNAEVNMIMQSVWLSLILASMWFRKIDKQFIHGFLMSAVIIATFISFASVLLMWSPSDSVHMTSVYFSSTTKIAEFIAHGIFSIPALAFGAWFVALWRPNSITFPAKSKRVVQLMVIMWLLSYLVGLLFYMKDYTILLGVY